MIESLKFWQVVFVLIGIVCISNGALVTLASPKKAMVEFAGISQMIFGTALTFFPFVLSF